MHGGEPDLAVISQPPPCMSTDSSPLSKVTFLVHITKVLVQASDPHCTGPLWTFRRVVDLLENELMSPFCTCLQAPTPGMAPGWGHVTANPGDVNILHHTKGIIAPDDIAPVIIPAQTLEQLKWGDFLQQSNAKLKKRSQIHRKCARM